MAGSRLAGGQPHAVRPVGHRLPRVRAGCRGPSERSRRARRSRAPGTARARRSAGRPSCALGRPGPRPCACTGRSPRPCRGLGVDKTHRRGRGHARRLAARGRLPRDRARGRRREEGGAQARRRRRRRGAGRRSRPRGGGTDDKAKVTVRMGCGPTTPTTSSRFSCCAAPMGSRYFPGRIAGRRGGRWHGTTRRPLGHENYRRLAFSLVPGNGFIRATVMAKLLQGKPFRIGGF